MLFAPGWPEHGGVDGPCLLVDNRSNKYLEPDQILAQTGAKFEYVFLEQEAIEVTPFEVEEGQKFMPRGPVLPGDAGLELVIH